MRVRQPRAGGWDQGNGQGVTGRGTPARCAMVRRYNLRKGILMNSLPSRPPTPEGPGSVSGAPHLPEGFASTFTSRYLDTGDVRLHAVIGGAGRRCC